MISIRKCYKAQAQVEDNLLRGVASVTGILDLDRDIILPGAFRRALGRFKERGFVANSHVWTWNNLVAMPISAEEKGNELIIEAVWHSTPLAQEARTVAMERIARGLAVGLSIGFSFEPSDSEEFPNGSAFLEAATARGYDPMLMDEQGIRQASSPVRAIYQVRDLHEVSLVPVPANPKAGATLVKAVAPFREDIPLGPRDYEWTASEAVARVREWAGGEEIDWSQYARAFFWHDHRQPELFGSYKLPYCDIINRRLHAIPRAIFAVAGVLQGARGGVDLPEADQQRLRAVVSKWYDRMRREFEDDTLEAPWDAERRARERQAALIRLATEVNLALARRRCDLRVGSE